MPEGGIFQNPDNPNIRGSFSRASSIQEAPTATYDVEAYSVGICTASVCAPGGMNRDEIERQVNAQHPTGISSQWRISEDETFATGQPMPCPCDRGGVERQHWLLNC